MRFMEEAATTGFQYGLEVGTLLPQDDPFSPEQQLLPKMDMDDQPLSGDELELLELLATDAAPRGITRSRSEAGLLEVDVAAEGTPTQQARARACEAHSSPRAEYLSDMSDAEEDMSVDEGFVPLVYSSAPLPIMEPEQLLPPPAPFHAQVEEEKEEKEEQDQHHQHQHHHQHQQGHKQDQDQDQPRMALVQGDVPCQYAIAPYKYAFYVVDMPSRAAANRVQGLSVDLQGRARLMTCESRDHRGHIKRQYAPGDLEDCLHFQRSADGLWGLASGERSHSLLSAAKSSITQSGHRFCLKLAIKPRGVSFLRGPADNLFNFAIGITRADGYSTCVHSTMLHTCSKPHGGVRQLTQEYKDRYATLESRFNTLKHEAADAWTA